MRLICFSSLLTFLISFAGHAQSSGSQSLRVMTFNLWHGGDGCGLSKDSSIQFQLAAIRQAKADVVGFQEQTDNNNQERAKLLADSLHWNYYKISSSRAIISRLAMEPINVSEKQPASHHGSAGNNAQAVLIHLDNKQLAVFGVIQLYREKDYLLLDNNLT